MFFLLTCLNHNHAEIRYVLNDSLVHQVAQSQAYLYLWTTLYKHTFDEHKLSRAWYPVIFTSSFFFYSSPTEYSFNYDPILKPVPINDIVLSLLVLLELGK